MCEADLEARLARAEQALHRLIELLAARGLVSPDEVAGLIESPAPPPPNRPPAARPPRQPSRPRPLPADTGTARATASQAGRLGAHSRWAREADRSAATAPARAGLLKRFEDEVDPDRVLPAAERAKRAESARRAFYQRIAMKSAAARAARRKGGGPSKSVDPDGN